jgi:hypothetical protein
VHRDRPSSMHDNHVNSNGVDESMLKHVDRSLGRRNEDRNGPELPLECGSAQQGAIRCIHIVIRKLSLSFYQTTLHRREKRMSHTSVSLASQFFLR